MKRFLKSSFLMILMVFCISSISCVYAADDSGTWGDSLAWAYNGATNTLVIDGNGEIPYTIIKLNSPNISLASILCKSAMQDEDKFLAIYIDEDKDAVSLRCNVEGIDLSVIAKECEGGGHKDAAGCKRSVLLSKSK